MSAIETLLIVDDEEELVRLYQELLSAKGFKCIGAKSGNEALKIYKETKIDLILSDVRMRDGDGLYLLDELNKLGKSNTIFILMTGYADFSDETVIAKGAAKLLKKPIKIKSLVELIESFNSK
jgi:DNA-binding NtrC family response regulator